MKKRNILLDDKPWNDSQGYLERIGNRWEECAQALLSGVMITVFRSLKIIYMDTHDHFKEEEKQECRKHWDDCTLELQNALATAGDAQTMILTDLEKKLDDWYMYLNKLCMDYELLYLKRKQITWQEKVKSNYE